MIEDAIKIGMLSAAFLIYIRVLFYMASRGWYDGYYYTLKKLKEKNNGKKKD